MKRALATAVSTVFLAAVPTLAADDAPRAKSLDELLKQVQAGWRSERAEIQRREDEFKRSKEEQQKKLADAKATRAREEQRSEEMELLFEQNETSIAELEETLRERLGTLGELFGVVRQVAGDTGGHLETSLVSSQLGGRETFLQELGQSKTLPSIESLEKLWFALQQEMTESGRVVRYPATILDADGQEVEREVIRVGVFNAISDGKYLRWLSEVGKLAELGRQPPARYLDTVRKFQEVRTGLTRFAIDPSRGSILSMVIDTPSRSERIQQGGPIGYAIIALGAVAGIVGLARLFAVILTHRKVKSQQVSEKASDKNPLGRVLAVYEANRSADVETLELKLDEAILRESAQLDRFLWAIKVVSVVAPLMGLLGTVTGMIRVFTTITLVGTGDPKMMASGISEALVTTMLGLFVAIPLVLIHAFVSSGRKEIVEVLEEQSAGIVARRAEGGASVAAG
ncbi:MAG: MotA/TolQ/ExbB proton channel family protein [Deltaproteobacteria bacterium]|nr:MAG: MotA/TolQ/ExbB proton channel family protein [Deltaproteobacteria bacterium]